MDGVERWAASGAMALTGHPHRRPLAPSRDLCALVDHLAAPLALPDPPALLGERATFINGHRQGRTSVGGPCRLLRTADGWLAVNLARDDDLALLGAWLDVDVELTDALRAWPVVEAEVARYRTAVLDERAALLGLPIAAVGLIEPVAEPYLVQPIGERAPAPSRPLVVDLSSLWAGPLCANLLGLRGARVVKVESTARPDGARLGPKGFFDLLHGGHEAVALDLRTTDGVGALRQLLARADVVVEASRPRVMANWGIDIGEVAARRAGLVWVSITAYGRSGEWANRVGFGDDAAASGGLVAYDHAGCPVFCADAVADPLAGITAAAAATRALTEGGGVLIEVALAAVASFLATGDTKGTWHESLVAARPPRARTAQGRGPRIGEHNARWS